MKAQLRQERRDFRELIEREQGIKTIDLFFKFSGSLKR